LSQLKQGKDAMRWRVRSFMGSIENCANVIVKGKRISQEH
jgi:hypothetical protein